MGFEGGFQSAGVRHRTIPSTWLNRWRELCDGERFDQVWFEARHTDFSDGQLERLAAAAPVRIAFLGESLNYTPEEVAMEPKVREARARVERVLKYATHLIACDEADVEEVNARRLAKAKLWVPAVGRRFVRKLPSSDPPVRKAAFLGSIYGDRATLLRHPQLRPLLVKEQTRETHFRMYRLYDAYHRLAEWYQRTRLPARWALGPYLYVHRGLRRFSYRLYAVKLHSLFALVNLPSAVKAYGSRIVEGMAAGCPVISWRIPGRPRTRELFEEGKEILLFDRDNPSELADCIAGLAADPVRARAIADNARRKLLARHTVETRVCEILDWIDNG